MTQHIGTERIHDLLDGLLSAAEEREIEEHVKACDACRRDVADLQELVAAMKALPASAEAPADAWEGIASRISGTAPGQEDDVKVVEFPGVSPARRRFHFTLPQLAAAAVVISVMSAGVVWTAMSGGFSAPATPGVEAVGASAVFASALEDPSYAAAVEELETVVTQGRDLLAPETVAALDEALQTIDGALLEVKEALEADPSSQLLGRMLVNHQRTRLRILRQAATAVQAVS